MFTQAGAEVVGVSNDQPEALIEFAKSQRLNFPLLSDEGGKLRKGLKVKGAAGASLSKKECKYAQMVFFCFHCHAELSSHHKGMQHQATAQNVEQKATVALMALGATNMLYCNVALCVTIEFGRVFLMMTECAELNVQSFASLSQCLLDVGDLLGLMPGRVTYVFNQTGVCVLSFNSALNANKHVEQAIAAIKTLAA